PRPAWLPRPTADLRDDRSGPAVLLRQVAELEHRWWGALALTTNRTSDGHTASGEEQDFHPLQASRRFLRSLRQFRARAGVPGPWPRAGACPSRRRAPRPPT